MRQFLVKKMQMTRTQRLGPLGCDRRSLKKHVASALKPSDVSKVIEERVRTCGPLKSFAASIFNVFYVLGFGATEEICAVLDCFTTVHYSSSSPDRVVFTRHGSLFLVAFFGAYQGAALFLDF